MVQLVAAKLVSFGLHGAWRSATWRCACLLILPCCQAHRGAPRDSHVLLRRQVDTRLSLETTDYRLRAIIPPQEGFDRVGVFSFLTRQQLLFNCLDRFDGAVDSPVSRELEVGILKVDKSPLVATTQYDWRDCGRFSPSTDVANPRASAEIARAGAKDTIRVPDDRAADLGLVSWFYRDELHSAALSGALLLAPVVSPSGLTFDIFSERAFGDSKMLVAAPMVPYEYDISGLLSQVRGDVRVHWVDRSDYVDRFVGEGELTANLDPTSSFGPVVEKLFSSGRDIKYAHSAHVRMQLKLSYEWNFVANRLESLLLDSEVAIEESWTLGADVSPNGKQQLVRVKAVGTATWKGTLTSTISNRSAVK